VLECTGYAAGTLTGSYNVAKGAAIAVYGAPSGVAIPVGVSLAAYGSYRAHMSARNFARKCI
jgi:hypothetical protein